MNNTTLVSARVSENVQTWLTHHFKSKTNGAEFTIPSCINIIRRADKELEQILTPIEIDAITKTLRFVTDGNTSFVYARIDYIVAHRHVLEQHINDTEVLLKKLIVMKDAHACALLLRATSSS